MLLSITLLGLGLATNCDLVESAKLKLQPRGSEATFSRLKDPIYFTNSLDSMGGTNIESNSTKELSINNSDTRL